MSNSTRIWVVFMSWNEYHKMKFFVNRSVEFLCWDFLLISWFARWESEHDCWIDEFDWSKIDWDYQASLLDLRETMRWLDVTYSYSRRKRNKQKEHRLETCSALHNRDDQLDLNQQKNSDNVIAERNQSVW
jgi:hypothetical protein